MKNAYEKARQLIRATGLSDRLELILPLAGGFSLLLALHAGLFVVFTLANFSQHTSTCALTLKTLQSRLQRFVFVDMDFRHLFSLPSHIPPGYDAVRAASTPIMGEWRPCVYYNAFCFVRQQLFTNFFSFYNSLKNPEKIRPINSCFRSSACRPGCADAGDLRSGRRPGRSWTLHGSRFPVFLRRQFSR